MISARVSLHGFDSRDFLEWVLLMMIFFFLFRFWGLIVDYVFGVGKRERGLRGFFIGWEKFDLAPLLGKNF